MAEKEWLMMIVVVIVSVIEIIIVWHFFPLILIFLSSRHIHGGRLPKGSFGWPLLGETLPFFNPHSSSSLGSFLQHHTSRYGKVFRSHLFLSPTIVSCEEELNYLILQNEGKLFECSYPKPIHGVLGKSSMLVSTGETHKRLRNVALSLVNITKASPHFLVDIEDIAIRILNSWNPGSHVVFCEEARKFTFDVIAKQVLGLSPDEPQSRKILQDFQTFMKGLVSLPFYIPGTAYARAVQARRRICSTVKAIMNEKRRNNGETTRSKMRDFLEIFLCDDKSLSEEERASFVMDSLLGGYETTSILLALVLHYLAHSPSALQQITVEHQIIRSMKLRDEYLNWEDYRKMKFTSFVINEALRCGNVVKFVHRKALKDIKYKDMFARLMSHWSDESMIFIKDYVIPRGWKVLPIFSAVHLDPCLHTSSLKFHPWRWENEEYQGSKKFTPFGGGSRCCPGFELAKVEIAFFLHHLVHKFSWRSVENEEPIAYPYVEFQRGLLLHVDRIINGLS